ncbi:D-hexose-6-phosphate mutarotase [Undibacterium jejuense]|uniref:Putative glucose-6-phosphate 1-epimerase n=1 Tax=Undibacterium jejuense TaxID=1344949 RepID=A0A923HCK0_9BURK|nr:D-hexose-6-phosphate mutarotase [Undibacterium jejuense]MBC3862027.1 D-hexose-6-phosphate mutarotase [Undibacterium jejuense]
MDFLTLTARDGATVSICHQGAHVCSWIPAGGTEQLFLSKKSEYQEGVAIRGGIPVIFPQFASMGTLPKHGFARTAEWKLLQQQQTEDGAAQAIFYLKENIARLTIWPHVFNAQLAVSVHDNSLQVALSIQNTGDTTFSFTSALHTYLAVNDIREARLRGLQGALYRDSLTGKSHCEETAELLHIEGETDRIYANVSDQLCLQQAHQHLHIHTTGFTDAVVWNPGPQAALKLSDMELDGDQRMLCVEAANIMRPISLAPGEIWTGSQSFMVTQIE